MKVELKLVQASLNLFFNWNIYEFKEVPIAIIHL